MPKVLATCWPGSLSEKMYFQTQSNAQVPWSMISWTGTWALYAREFHVAINTSYGFSDFFYQTSLIKAIAGVALKQWLRTCWII